MALFGKKSLADFSLEELTAEIEKRKQAESKAEPVAEAPKAEPAVEKTAEPVAEPTTEVAPEVKAEPEAEKPEMEEPVKEEAETEEAPKDEEQADAHAEVMQALNAKVETALEEIRAYKEKVDALLAKVGEAEKPAESVGLEKSKKVEDAKGDDELSAGEYAKKYAKY